MTPDVQNPRGAIRRLNLMGLAALVLLVGGIGGWAATSELTGAVIAQGSLVVESSVKKVQHPTGGVVGEILVREGSEVQEGQVVLRLDDTVTRATLGIVRSQLDELVAREARLLAERDGSETIAFPDAMTSRQNEPAVAAAMAGEQKLFEARRNARNGQRSQLRERIGQINEEVLGLTAQLAAKEQEINFIKEELTGVTELYQKNLTPIIRYMQLQRDQAKLSGEHGQLIADRARAQVKIGETELQIIQVDQDFRTDVLKDLRESQGKIAELRERVTAAEDQLKRVDIRAPQDGIVHQLSVHTVGGVISAGETIMEIVPRADALVVEAKVAPQDIDQLAIGAPTSIRVQAGNQRMTPVINGVLTRIPPDITRETPNSREPQQAGQIYYLVRVSLDPQEVRRLGDLKLVPGMPVEAFIRTQDRTPLQYLLKPLREQIARTFRER